jgi:hypothetical protein
MTTLILVPIFTKKSSKNPHSYFENCCKKKIGIILQKSFFISEERNDLENFPNLKREIIHSSLSPLYIQKLAMKFIYVVEDTQMMIHAKNKKKLNDRLFWGTSSCNTLTKTVKYRTTKFPNQHPFHINTNTSYRMIVNTHVGPTCTV